MESELVYLMEYGIKLWIEARVGGHPFIVFVLRTVLDKYYCTTVLDKFHILQCLSHCAEGSWDLVTFLCWSYLQLYRWGLLCHEEVIEASTAMCFLDDQTTVEISVSPHPQHHWTLHLCIWLMAIPIFWDRMIPEICAIFGVGGCTCRWHTCMRVHVS